VESATVAKAILAEPWDYADSETQYLTHNIHRYSGKFIPQIAARAISILTREGELVLDPYCGSGTTLLEAALSGRHAVGLDLNPLAVLIARTKVTPVDPEKLSWLTDTMTSKLAEDGQMLLMAPGDNDGKKSEARTIVGDARLENPRFLKWFARPILTDLVRIDHQISSIADPQLRNIALVAFSDILRRSSNAHSGYPNVMFDKKAPPRPRPIQPFLASLRRVAKMVAMLANAGSTQNMPEVLEGNATSIPIDKCSVDAVVSHPPYIGSIPYAEYGTLSLLWLGIDSRELDARLTGGRRQSADVVQRFRDDYGRMLRETQRILRAGRFAFLMVGSPVVRGEIINLPQMTKTLAAQAGLRLVVETTRKGMNRRANKMGSESILVFEKPEIKPPTTT
jgi:site-specific DNA-methyltransferase (cytosine-N4-specific)